jgi:hypothetical protein
MEPDAGLGCCADEPNDPPPAAAPPNAPPPAPPNPPPNAPRLHLQTRPRPRAPPRRTCCRRPRQQNAPDVTAAGMAAGERLIGGGRTAPAPPIPGCVGRAGVPIANAGAIGDAPSRRAGWPFTPPSAGRPSRQPSCFTFCWLMGSNHPDHSTESRKIVSRGACVQVHAAESIFSLGDATLHA